MPGRHTRISLPIQVASRVGYCCGLAALALIFTTENLQTAAADGETRTLYFQHTHRDDEITITYKRNGRLIPEALKKLDWYLRDWRTDDVIHMDPRLYDLLWEVRHEFSDDKPIRIISSYRTPKTNAMLRRRGRGVARHSQHMAGKAIDFYIPDVPLEELRIAGLRLQRGGVGYYPTSGSPFVHMDVARVRHWPRMTREQLVRVFPNGRTVHIPRDGRPLKNYALALADIKRRGDSPSGLSLEVAEEAGALNAGKNLSSPLPAARKLLAKLFGFGHADEEEARVLTSSTGRGVTPRAGPHKPTVVASAAHKPHEAEPTVPLPTRRRTMQSTFQLASAEPARPAQAASLFAAGTRSANEIIKQRGYWQGLPEAPAAPSKASHTPRRVAALAPEASAARRQAGRKAGPATTASITPWPVNAQNDRVSPEIALSYAALETPHPPSRAAAMGTRLPTNLKTAAIPPHTTVATKASGNQPTTALTAQSLLAAAARAHPKAHANDPWLRAMVLSPDVRKFMSTALLGMPDFRKLRPLMQKPSSAVMMTFALEPYLGLAADRFAGNAVVFVSTVTFNNRTAVLR